MERTRRERIILLVLPVPLISVTYAAFTLGARWLGNDGGYILGFGVYWVCCLGIPFMLWGRRAPGRVLGRARQLGRMERWVLISILAATVIGALVMYFIPEVSSVTLPILLLSPVGIITGVAEESLWRGAYVSTFGSNVWLAVAFPTFAYTLAHLSPLAVVPAEGGTIPFLVSVAFLGLVYGIVAYRTGSARWSAFAHASAGLLAFGGAVAPAIARILGFEAQ